MAVEASVDDSIWKGIVLFTMISGRGKVQKELWDCKIVLVHDLETRSVLRPERTGSATETVRRSSD